MAPRPSLSPPSAAEMIPKTRSPSLKRVELLASTTVPERSASGTAEEVQRKEEGRAELGGRIEGEKLGASALTWEFPGEGGKDSHHGLTGGR